MTPFQSAATPSSLAMHMIVASVPPAAAAAATGGDGSGAFLCSWSRTLAVSKGMVHTSAKQAAKALLKKMAVKEDAVAMRPRLVGGGRSWWWGLVALCLPVPEPWRPGLDKTQTDRGSQGKGGRHGSSS